MRVTGARTYYLNRSQPPLMSAMIKIVYAATQNRTLLTTALPVRSLHAKYILHRQELPNPVCKSLCMQHRSTYHVTTVPCRSQHYSVVPLLLAASDPGARVLDVGAKAGASARCQRHKRDGVQPLALPCRVDPAAPRVIQVRWQ